MSKFRNRNIRNKLEIPISVKSQPDITDRTIESGIHVKPSFSEVINKIYSYNICSRSIWDQVNSLSSCGSSDIEIIDDDGYCDDNSFDNKSTTSSLSWGEDYETHATELVKKEFEQMERVLQCLEPIPSTYDRDEYKLWIKTFPCLRLTGRSSPGQSAQSKISILNEDVDNEKRINKNAMENKNCDKTTSNSKKTILNFKINNSSVIDKRLEESSRNQDYFMEHQLKSNNTYQNSNKALINNTINPSTLELKFDSFLTISAAPFNSFRNHSRFPSSNVAFRANTSLNQADEFASLPYLSENLSQTNRMNTDANKHNYIGDSDFTVLPPIDITSKNNYPYRSISATNRTKTSVSAYSLKSPVNEVDDVEINSISFSENGFKKPPRRRRRFVDL